MVAPVQPGEVLAGKFAVEHVLGAGGMGVVVVAQHLELEQRVALKFLLPEALADEEAVRRFKREAKAASRIQSEHVARILDVGTMPNGAPYLVMEYLDGADLSTLLRERGPLAPDDAVDFTLQALEALAQAHKVGVVHRDIKPSNLFLTHRADGSPCIKVLDFGIAKVGGFIGDAATTKTSALMGSPWYISPEQLRSTKSVDGRADLWSLGVVLHELLTGRPTFAAETLPQLCTAILHDAPTLLTASLPPPVQGLDAVIRRCLAKDAAERFGSAAELARALAPFAPRRSQVSLERIARMGAAPLDATLPADKVSPATLRAGQPEAAVVAAAGGGPGPSGPAPSTGASPEASAPQAATGATFAATTPPARRGSRMGAAWAVGAGAALAVVALVVAFVRSPSHAAHEPSPAAPTLSAAAPPAAQPNASVAVPETAGGAAGGQPVGSASAASAAPAALEPAPAAPPRSASSAPPGSGHVKPAPTSPAARPPRPAKPRPADDLSEFGERK